MPRRSAALGVLACVLVAPSAHVAPAAAEPAVESAPAAAKLALLRASEANVMPGERITFTAGRPRVRGFKKLRSQDKGRARVVLQRHVGDEWRKVAVRNFKGKKRVTLPFRARGDAAGTIRFRTMVRVKGRQFRGGRMRLPVVAPHLSTAPSSVATGATIDFATSLVPARAGRTIALQVHEGGAWQPLGDAVATQGGAGVLRATAPGHPVWYRVVTDGWNGANGLTTAPVRTSLDRVPTVVAHRAGAGAAPEQTLAAVRQALAQGVPSMEVDVQLSKDGVPVIVHDATLARTTNVEEVFPDRAPWNLSDFTLAEIKQLDAGSWFDARFAGERIPTLDEVITEIGGRSRLVLEVKSPGAAGNVGIEQVLADELASGALGQVAAAGRLTVSSFDVPWLEQFATAHPDVPVGVLTTPNPTATQLEAWKGWAEEVHPQYLIVSRASIDGIRARGMTSSVWTVNDVAGFRRAVGLGVDRIITDFPGRLDEVVNPPRP